MYTFHDVLFEIYRISHVVTGVNIIFTSYTYLQKEKRKTATREPRVARNEDNRAKRAARGGGRKTQNF
jgi:hypothetical protein